MCNTGVGRFSGNDVCGGRRDAEGVDGNGGNVATRLARSSRLHDDGRGGGTLLAGRGYLGGARLVEEAFASHSLLSPLLAP